MKRNLFAGVVLVSVMALSSCSSTNKLNNVAGINDDDVYYTQAKAGDVSEFADAGYDQPYGNNYQNYSDYDDYYYYGDYASRINRFGYFSPFDYGDNFYYNYSPYNRFSLGLGLGFGSPYYSGFPAYGYGSLYSPFYSPWSYGGYYGYGLGYGGYGLGGYYGGLGYGGLGWGGYYGYGGYGLGGYYGGLGFGGYGWGGYGGRSFVRQQARPGYANGAPARGQAYRNGTNPVYNNPTRRPNATGNITNPNTRAVRPVREDNIRQPQRQTTERMPSFTPNTSSGSSGGSSSSGGGGGRPVRQ